MIPDQRLSTTTLTAPFLHPDGLVTSPLKDYELGGRALNDPSEGLQVQVWACFVDGDDIMIQAGDSTPEVLFTAAGTTEVALAFDQNMRPAVAFTQSGTPKLRWYDTLVGAQVITEYPDVDNLRLGLDDKRQTQLAANDIILAYTRDGGLYFRAQRDRFTIEYTLSTNVGVGRLLRIGLNTGNRFQFEFYRGADPTDLTWPTTGTLWEIPADAGFSEGEIVGLWAEAFGFLGFQEITTSDDTLVVQFAATGIPADDVPTELVIGYPYSAKFQPLPMAQPDGQGPIMGRKRRLIRAILSVEDAASILVEGQPLLPMTGEGQSRKLTARTGEFEVRVLGWTSNDEIQIEAMSPYHATIRAMLREYNQ